MQLDQYQTDHLFVLIGGNPLPSYVASKLLLHPGGVIHLVYTGESKRFADGLMEVIGAQAGQAVVLQHESNPKVIENALEPYKRAIRSNQTVGLHYTGGTKVMAVHTYRVLKEWRSDLVASYLDPRHLELCIEVLEHTHVNQKRYHLKAKEMNNLADLTLHNLWRLHQIKLRPDPTTRQQPGVPELAQLIGKRYANDERDAWVRWTSKLSAHDLLASCPFPEISAAFQAQALQKVADLSQLPGCRGKTWLEGDWLEDYVLYSLQQIAADLDIKELFCSAKTDPACGYDFEVDVIALRGYQLFAFSCGVSDAKDKCKLKLFEINTRANQLGGDEARFALVCGYDNGPALKQEIGGLITPDRFEVFDRFSLEHLADELRSWIKRVDREMKP